MKIRLHRIGADPELVSVYKKDNGSAVLMPASEYFDGAKELGLALPVGLDGHAPIWELRPRPAHSIYGVFLDIGDGLVTLSKFLPHSARLAASPKVFGKSLAGHLHGSFVVEDPNLKDAIGKNIMPGPLVKGYSNTAPTPKSLSSVTAFLNDLSTQGLVFDPWVFTHAVDWLMMPLEFWVQPWDRRYSRNTAGGDGGSHGYGLMWFDHPRWVVHPPDQWPDHVPPDGVYVHYEYRTPSTWLRHPLLTLLYLMVFKLAVTNLPALIQLAASERQVCFKKINQGSVPKVVAPLADYATEGALFFARLELVLESAQLTEDIVELPELLNETVTELQERWVKKQKSYINIQAWEEAMA
jgi:hypothetical protein